MAYRNTSNTSNNPYSKSSIGKKYGFSGMTKKEFTEKYNSGYYDKRREALEEERKQREAAEAAAREQERKDKLQALRDQQTALRYSPQGDQSWQLYAAKMIHDTHSEDKYKQEQQRRSEQNTRDMRRAAQELRYARGANGNIEDQSYLAYIASQQGVGGTNTLQAVQKMQKDQREWERFLKEQQAELQAGYKGLKRQQEEMGGNGTSYPITVEGYKKQRRGLNDSKNNNGLLDKGYDPRYVSDAGLQSWMERQRMQAEKAYGRAGTIQNTWAQNRPAAGWENVLDYLKGVDENGLSKKPADYAGKEEEYNRQLYDAVYGDGVYARRVDSLQTDTEADRLDAELEQLWDRWSRGEIPQFVPDEESPLAMQQKKEEETRQLSIDKADDFFTHEYDPEIWALDATQEEQREALFDRLTNSGETYEEVAARLTPAEKAELDRRLDAVLEGAKGSYTDLWDQHAYKFAEQLEIGGAYNDLVKQGEQEQEFRKTLEDFGTQAKDLKAQGYTGEYDPDLIGEAPHYVEVEGDTEGMLRLTDPGWTETDKAYYIVNNPHQIGGTENFAPDTSKYLFMDDEQAEQFNVFFEYDKKNGTHMADSFLEGIDNYLQTSLTEYQDYYARAIADDPARGIPARILSYPMKLGTGLIGAAGTVAALLGNESAKEAGSGWYSLDKLLNTIRDQQNTSIDEALGGSGVAKFFLGLADNIGDNLAAMGAGSVLSGGNRELGMKLVQAIMSGSATSSRMVEMLGSGKDPTEAALYAIGDGAIEWITEKYSLEELLQPDVKAMLGNKRQLAMFIAKNIAAEGSEEMASDLLNIALDSVLSTVYGHDSELMARYKEVLRDVKDKRKASQIVLQEKLGEIGMSGLAGAISGGFLSGGRVGLNTITQNQMGQNVYDNKNVQKLLDVGLGMKEGTQSRQMAEDLLEKKHAGQKPTNGQLGKLAQLMTYETNEESGKIVQDTIRNNVQQDLEAEGVKNAREFAEIISRNLFEGGRMSRVDRAKLAESKAAIEVWKSYNQVDSLKTAKTTIEAAQNTAGQQSVIDTISDLTSSRAKSTGVLAADIEKAIKQTGSAAEAIDYLQKSRSGLLSEGYAQKAKELLESDPEAKKNTNYLDDVMKVRMAAMTLGDTVPETRLSKGTAQALFDAAREEFNQRDQERLKNQVKIIPGQGVATFEGAEYGTDAWKEKMQGLTKQQRDQMGALGEIVTRLGNRLNLVNDPDHKGIYGFEDNTGTITINVAGMNRSGIQHHMLVTMSHELTHWLEQNSREGYDTLRKYVLNSLRSKGNSIEKMIVDTIDNLNTVLGAKSGDNLDINGAMAEIVAKSCENLLSSEAFRDEIAKTNPSLANKIKTFVKNFAARVRQAIQGMSGSLSREARALYDQTEEIARIWLGAREEALGRENTGEEITEAEKVNYSIQETIHDPDTLESNKYIVANMEPVITLNGNEFTLGDPKHKIKAMNFYEEMKGVNSKAAGWVVLDKQGVRDTYAHGIGPLKALLFASIPSVLEKGEIIGYTVNWKNRGHDTAIIAAPVKVINGNLKGKYYVGAIINLFDSGKNKIYNHDGTAIITDEKGNVVQTAGPNGSDRSNASLLTNILKRLNNYNGKSGEYVKLSMKELDKQYEIARKNKDDNKMREIIETAARKAGYDLIVYHGTPTGGFTQFKNWSYFTENKAYADRYNHSSASSIRGYTVNSTRPMTYELYMNPGRVFDTRNPAAAKVYNNARIEYGMGSLLENGLPDWTDGRDIIDYIEENNMPYDTVLLDEGADGGYGQEVIKRGISYVSRSNMIKSTELVTYDDNGEVIPPSKRFNQQKSDIRFSVEQSPDMEVDRFMLGLNEFNMPTAQERTMLRQYKDLHGTIDVLRMKIRDRESMQRQLLKKQTEQGGKLSAYDREQMRKINNWLSNDRMRLEKVQAELVKVTGTKGYARLMMQQDSLMKNLINGVTADQMISLVEDMSRQLDEVNKAMQERAGKLEQLAQKEAVLKIRTQFNQNGLRQIAAKLKADMNSDLETTEIENRLALIALKMKEGKYDSGTAEELTDLILGKMRGEYDSYVLSTLRGRRIALSPAQLKELKATDSSIRELNAELAGTGIRFVASGGTNLEHQWGEISREITSLDPDAEPLQQVDELMRVIRSERNTVFADRFNNENVQKTSEAVLQAAAKLVPEIVTDEKSLKLIRETLQFVREISGQAAETAGEISDLTAVVDRLKKTGAAARSGANKLTGDINEAISYFNALSEQSEAAMWKKERILLIDQLKNEKTQELLAEQEKWKQKIEKDKNVRQKMDSNLQLRQKITTNVSRIRKLLVNETDLKNVPEHMKGLAREMLDKIVNNDLAGRKISGIDKQDLIETRRILDAMEKQDGYFTPDDLRLLHDEEAQAAVFDALAELEDGIGFYNNRLTGNDIMANLQGLHNALSKISDAVSTITSVINAERSLSFLDRRMDIQDAADDIRRDLGKSRFKGERAGAGRRARNTINSTVFYGNMTPVYFFKMLRNGGMDLLWKDMQQGENRSGLETQKAKAFMQELAYKTKYKSWADNKYKVTLGGKKMELTIGKMMELYAIWKREQTTNPEMSQHLAKGGVYIQNNEEQEKGKPRREKTEQRAVRVTDQEIADMYGQMTDEQKEYLDSVVKYLSNDMSKLGNEASMRMYGIEKYKESYYFPMKVWDGVKSARSDKGITGTDENRAAHKSWSKRRMHMAQNALVIGDFTTDAVNHIVEMINYNTMAPAIENVNKVLNYQFTEGTNEEDYTKRNMRIMFEEAYGKEALRYLETFMKDLNGGVTQDQRKSLFDATLAMFKKNAVAGSLSVALQQPLSYIRAAMMISPKYLAEGLNPKYWKGSYNEMMKYSGVAVIKDMGRFDMNFGQSAKDFITPETKVNVYEKISDALTAAPEMMDRMTWTRMWSAVKAEQHAKHSDMDVNSEKFLQMVGERFNEVMRTTQVYDSVLVKSSNMRSQKWQLKILTSFMAEPTLSLNVLSDAVGKVRAGDKGAIVHATKAAATFFLSAVMQAAVKGLMGSGRTPDEKKTWLENFLNKLQYNLQNEANPLSLIPGYSDVIELLKKGELKDDAMGALGKLATVWDTAQKAINGKGRGWYRDIEDTAGQLAQLFTNVPAKNLMRDGRAIFNWITGGSYAARPTSNVVLKYQAIDNLMTADTLLGTLNEKMGEAGYLTSNKAYYSRMYEAEKAGNQAGADEIREYLTLGKGVKEETIRTGIRGLAKADDNLSAEERIRIVTDNSKTDGASDYIIQQLKDGEITDTQARQMIKKLYPDKKDDDIYWQVDRQKYMKETGKEKVSGFYYRLVDAVNANKAEDIRKAVKELLGHGITKKQVKDKLSDWKSDYLAADNAKRVKIRDAITKAYKAAGFTVEEADKLIERWLKEKKKKEK